jgi:hypothetical protein
MEYDGAYLWVSNGGTGTLTRITVSDGSTDTVSQEPTWSDVGPIAFDGVHLWVVDNADSGDDDVYGYNIANEAIEGSVGLSDSDYNDLIFDGSHIWAANDTTLDKVQVGRGHGYSLPVYPRGIMLYGEDDQYHCIYFDSSGVLQDSSSLTYCL